MSLHTIETMNENDPIIKVITASHGGPEEAMTMDTGYYLLGHWNFDLIVPKGTIKNSWPEIEDYSSIGVCDSLEQFDKLLGNQLRMSDRKFAVAFVEIKKSDQDSVGGWRWHKWGEYIGDHKIQEEYLYDEVGIERVFTYHIYELN